MKWFSYLAQEAAKRGISLPTDIKSVGELVLFLQWEVTTPELFISWINANHPSDPMMKQHFHYICSILVNYLEEWQDRPSDYEWIAMMQRGDFDE